MKHTPIRMRTPRKDRNSKKVGTTVFVTVELKKELDNICKEIGVTPSLLLRFLIKDLKDFKQLRKDIDDWRWRLEHSSNL